MKRRRRVAWAPVTALLAAATLLALLVVNLFTLAGIQAIRRPNVPPSRTRVALGDAEWIDVAAGLGLVGLLALLFIIRRDVERREELEEALRESMRFQEQFVAILGHDLRNPLGAIAMGASAIENHSPSARDAAIAARIGTSVTRMSRLTEQLLDLSRARMAGGIPVAPRPGANLSDMAKSVIDELRTAHPETTLELANEPTIEGFWDPDRVAQVISNLVGNAIEHGAGAPVEVQVGGSNGTAILRVHNGGPPIPGELLPHIFDPFRYGSASGQGLGLGLYIADQIVRAHGGSIVVRSSEGEGTTFEVMLPRRSG